MQMCPDINHLGMVVVRIGLFSSSDTADTDSVIYGFQKEPAVTMALQELVRLARDACSSIQTLESSSVGHTGEYVSSIFAVDHEDINWRRLVHELRAKSITAAIRNRKPNSTRGYSKAGRCNK